MMGSDGLHAASLSNIVTTYVFSTSFEMNATMRYPTDQLILSESTYPIKCYSGFRDGFSGWYAISNRHECNDFCFWEVDNSNGSGYDASNVEDPHQSTQVYTRHNTTSNWRCALNVADDSSVWSLVDSRMTPLGYFGSKFPYLQCSKGAGEVLENGFDLVLKNMGFWVPLLLFGIIFMLIQIVPSKSYNPVPIDGQVRHQDEEVGNEEEVSSENDLQDEPVTDEASHSLVPVVNQRRRCYGRNRLVLFVRIVANIGIIAVITISIASLIDIRGKHMMLDKVMRFTPMCYNQYTECQVANRDIDRPSNAGSSPNPPFSYLVASDSQLDWWNGESVDIGSRAIPRACSPNDSCKSCTAKHGGYTNELMRTSMRMLVNGTRIMETENVSQSSIPKTLVMNGDLTAYFHPRERYQYESIYHNLEGLESFFPALGNHEVAHGSAKYGGDQWVGETYCNSKHSLGYIRSGFCGKIPKFDSERIVRFDSSSLAYSWEEGRFHFVHTHYFPSFESAGIRLKSSIAWLDRDISLAYHANLITILFVHASQGLVDVMEHILLGRNVAAIFAGHSHRCFMRKCIAPTVVYEDQIGNANSTDVPDSYDTCLPAMTSLCGGNAQIGGMSLYYLQNKSEGFVPPATDLFFRPFIDPKRKVCPAPRKIAIINNTMLCRRVVWGNSEFPARQDEDVDTDDRREHIPIFYSGSASFQTFLKVDFLDDRLIVNGMTAQKGMEGKRYKDTHAVPNVVYPYHEMSDMEEVTIPL